jgi:hypothetical protein
LIGDIFLPRLTFEACARVGLVESLNSRARCPLNISRCDHAAMNSSSREVPHARERALPTWRDAPPPGESAKLRTLSLFADGQRQLAAESGLPSRALSDALVHIGR